MVSCIASAPLKLLVLIGGMSSWRRRHLLPATTLVLLITASVCQHARGLELLENNDYEGDPGVWPSEARSLLIGEEPRGDWFLSTVGGLTPISLMPTRDGGGSDASYGVSDQFESGPDQRGTNEIVMYQEFHVPDDSLSVTLMFDMFVNDWSSRSSFSPLQHARVDLMVEDADPYNVDDFVLANFYLGTDGGPLPNPFRHYEFNITPFVESGGQYMLRFYQINGIDILNVGLDNVSIQFVPEPSTWALLLGAMVSCCYGRRRNSGRSSPFRCRPRTSCAQFRHRFRAWFKNGDWLRASSKFWATDK